jgi:uncharacterized protein with ParB-like and HNH nuclease domain
MTFQAVQEPRVTYLEQMMKDIEAGVIKVPRFQRREVWTWEAQRDLLCSVFEGLPIGAILLWQTRLPNIKSRKTIGPFNLPNQDFSPIHSYILDGLQRLTTIYSMVYHPRKDVSNLPKSNVSDYTVYCDLDAESVEDKFLLESQLSQLNIDSNNPRYFPLRHVFNSKEVMKFQRSISEENENWIDKIDELVSSFKNYKLPIVPLASDDQQLATKSFERVNTRGETMSETHMLNALSYSDKFELLERLEVNTEKYLGDDYLWSEGLDDDFILMAMKLSVGKGPYFKKTDELAKLIEQKHVENVFRSLKSMIDFSFQELHIEAPNSFPYKLQMLGLTYAFMSNKNLNKEALIAWFHLTSYYGVFGLTARVSENALNDFISFIDTGTYVWTSTLPKKLLPIPKDINYRSSRSKALLFAMAEKLGKSDNENYFQHVAQKKGRSVILASEFGVLDKRTGFLFMTTSKTFSINEINENELELHFLDNEMLECLKHQDYLLFAQLREKQIFDWEVSKFVRPSENTLKIETLI